MVNTRSTADVIARVASSPISAAHRRSLLQELNAVDESHPEAPDRIEEIETQITEAEEEIAKQAAAAAALTPNTGTPDLNLKLPRDPQLDRKQVDRQEEKKLPKQTLSAISPTKRYYYWHAGSEQMEWTSHGELKEHLREISLSHISSSIKEAAKYANKTTSTISSYHLFSQIRSLVNFITCPIIRSIAIHASRGYEGYIAHALHEYSINDLTCLQESKNIHIHTRGYIRSRSRASR